MPPECISNNSWFLETGVPPTYFYLQAVYCDAPFKLLVWAVSPCRSHAALGATVCGQVSSWALIPGRAWKTWSEHTALTVAQKTKQNKGTTVSMWNVTQRTCTNTGFNCGKSQGGITGVVVSSWVEALGSKYLSKIRALDCLGNELSEIYDLMGVHVWWQDNRSKGSCRFLSFLHRTVFKVVYLHIFTHERLQVSRCFLLVHK